MASSPEPTADELYAELVAAHRGLTAVESVQLNARLILLLMARLRDPEAIRAAIRHALDAGERRPEPDDG